MPACQLLLALQVLPVDDLAPLQIRMFWARAKNSCCKIVSRMVRTSYCPVVLQLGLQLGYPCAGASSFSPLVPVIDRRHAEQHSIMEVNSGDSLVAEVCVQAGARGIAGSISQQGMNHRAGCPQKRYIHKREHSDKRGQMRRLPSGISSQKPREGTLCSNNVWFWRNVKCDGCEERRMM